MDPFTHGALGVSVAMAVAGKGANPRHAAVAGLAAALLPDIDIFFREPGDPLAIFRWHRHFTHSLAFTPVIALAGAGLAQLALIRHAPRFRDLLAPAWAAAVSHGLNDTGTSYGTMLYLPFSRERAAWDILPIVDPVALTLPLLLLVGIAVVRKSRVFAAAATAWMLVYAGVGVIQRERAETALRAFAAARGETPDRLTVKPAPLSLVLWRGVYESNGRIQAVAIRPGVSELKLRAGDSQKILGADHPDRPKDGTAAGDTLDELQNFTGGWLTATPLADGRTLIGDARFSMLPHDIEPLWGITVRPGHDDELPQAHFRQRDEHTPYRAFFDMLFDNDPGPAAP